MDSSNLLEGLEQLDDEIDDLEESLESLLKTALSDTTSKLPLLDKAKLYVLVTYAIESALFSYLRLNGVAARKHPVFTELARVKQYFAKIKAAEIPARPPNMSLDLPAVGRFIKAGLSGNDKYDTERAERIAKERAKAHIRFTQLSKKRKAEDQDEEEKSSSSGSEVEVVGQGLTGEELPKTEEVKKDNESNDVAVMTKKAAKKERRRKKRKSSTEGGASGPPLDTVATSVEENSKHEQDAGDKNAFIDMVAAEKKAKKKEKARLNGIENRERQAVAKKAKKAKKANSIVLS